MKIIQNQSKLYGFVTHAIENFIGKNEGRKIKNS